MRNFFFLLFVLWSCLLFACDDIYVTNIKDSGPGSLREAVSKPGDKNIIFAVSGEIKLETDLWLQGNCVIDASHLNAPLVISQRGLIWDKAQDVTLKHICIWSGTSTVLGKITGPWEQYEGYYRYRLPELVAKNLVDWSDLEDCWYSPNGVPPQTQLGEPYTKCNSWAIFTANTEAKAWCFDPKHDREHVYLKTDEYSPTGECVVTTKKSTLPDPITIRNKGEDRLGVQRFENCTFALGCDNTVFGYGEFYRCFFAYGISLDYHPKLVGHSKALLIDIPGTLTKLNECVLTDVHGRCPRLQEGCNLQMTNCLLRKGTHFNVEIDSRKAGLGCTVDIVNNVFENNDKYSLWLLLGDEATNQVHLSSLRIMGTDYPDPWVLAHVHTVPFAARNQLGTTGASPPNESQKRSTPSFPLPELVPLNGLKAHLLSHCGPKNKSAIDSLILRSVRTNDSPKIFAEFK